MPTAHRHHTLTSATADTALPRLVVFDVDGTLYEHGPMARRMLLVTAGRLMRSPRRSIRELRAIWAFRQERERMAEAGTGDVTHTSYTRASTVLGTDSATARTTLNEWLIHRPIEFMVGARRPGLDEVFAMLKGLGIHTAIFSDMYAHHKIEAFGLDVDKIVCADDPQVDRLKPHPRGLEYLMEHFGVPPQETLFVGDRAHKDLACARNAGVPCLMVDGKKSAVHKVLLPGFDALVDDFAFWWHRAQVGC